MRRLFSLILLMICTMPVWADNLDQLYKAAGWPDQRAHFNDALSAAQAASDFSLIQSTAGTAIAAANTLATRVASNGDNVAKESLAAAATLIEAQALRWTAEFVGFPAAGGSFTSGGTVSNVTALAAARERAVPDSRAQASTIDSTMGSGTGARLPGS